MQLSWLLLHLSEFLLEQIKSMERVVDAEQLVQATAVSWVLISGVAIVQQVDATALENLPTLGLKQHVLQAAHLFENRVHHLGDVEAVVDDVRTSSHPKSRSSETGMTAT